MTPIAAVLDFAAKATNDVVVWRHTDEILWQYYIKHLTTGHMCDKHVGCWLCQCFIMRWSRSQGLFSACEIPAGVHGSSIIACVAINNLPQ